MRRSPGVRMKCNKDCIANVCGECAVEKCEGQIQRLGMRNNNAETAAWTYKIAVDSFKKLFWKEGCRPMNAIENQVRELVAVELSAANERFPQFHSCHEGYAVILEELEEAKAELEVAEAQTNNLWEHIKSNYDGAGCAETVMKFAINAACEAIQVAAMCQKFLEMENRA